jgi:tripartite ATP-independent transporter DctM subunit
MCRWPLPWASWAWPALALRVAGSRPLASAAQVVYETGFAYTLSVIPLFILMGNFVARAGLAHELFHAAYAFIGHLRGGLAHATIAACAGFGAICGSSIATAATMSKVAYPSMKKLGYSDSLSTGVMAAGGTLGIMIPPSTIMVIYGIVTETNIGKLFAAGVCPGILTALHADGPVVIVTGRDPEHAPAGERIHLGRALGACAASGACCCWWCWCWAASTAACSPQPRARASARRAPFCLRWRAGADLDHPVSTCWSNRPAPRPCCSRC